MWGSVLGGLIGALVGGVVTYFVQRKLESRREHEQTLRKVRRLADELVGATSAAIGHHPVDGDFDPRRVTDAASKIELFTTKLDDKDLQRTILETLHGKYESREAIIEAMWELRQEVDQRAFPVLHDFKEDVTMDLSPLFDEDANLEWRGPAHGDFMTKARREELFKFEQE